MLIDYRDAAQARSDDLTLTTIYNLVDAVRSGETLSKKEQRLHTLLGTDTLIRLHDDLDRAVAAAYGWEWPLDEQEILSRLVALNHERAREEAEGHVRWLRPDRAQAGAKGTAAKEVARAAQKAQVPWPKDRKAQRRQVFAAIDGATTPMTIDEIAQGFKGAGPAKIGALVEELEELGFVVVGDEGEVRRG